MGDLGPPYTPPFINNFYYYLDKPLEGTLPNFIYNLVVKSMEGEAVPLEARWS